MGSQNSNHISPQNWDWMETSNAVSGHFLFIFGLSSAVVGNPFALFDTILVLLCSDQTHTKLLWNGGGKNHLEGIYYDPIIGDIHSMKLSKWDAQFHRKIQKFNLRRESKFRWKKIRFQVKTFQFQINNVKIHAIKVQIQEKNKNNQSSLTSGKAIQIPIQNNQIPKKTVQFQALLKSQIKSKNYWKVGKK